MNPPDGRSCVSVVIGAGFSLNAVPRSSSTKTFPTWVDLAEQFAQRLFPSDEQTAERKKCLRSAASTSGVLRLAKEFEVAFGPAELRRFIRDAIPDLDYSPGSLHQKLFELNWADIFTTNYDTLLERQSDDPDTRNDYNVVLSPRELPLCQRPRIVKLHGTLPGLDDLVLTEDHYREYPTTYAPFVSEFQVALMETHLCMIGFSGDDPNFLAWTGWVRDQLKTDIPFLYFFTFDDLPAFRRRLLEERRIIPLHLPSLFGDDLSKQEHLSALFEELGKPTGPGRPAWNRYSNEPTDDIDATISKRRHAREASATTWLEQAIEWRAERLNYLGWLIAPRHAIERLWEATEDWVFKLPPASDLKVPALIFVLWELTWRCRTTLFPLYDATVSDVLLPALNAFDEWLEKNIEFECDGSFKPSTIPVKAGTVTLKLPTKELVSAAIELHLEAIRHSREIGDFDRFWKLAKSLDSVLDVAPTNLAVESQRVTHIKKAACDILRTDQFLAHQESLVYLTMGQHLKAHELVSNWNTDGQPEWSMRKAGVLASLGDSESARDIWKDEYRRRRRQRRGREPGIQDDSCFAWLAFFLRRVKGLDRIRGLRPKTGKKSDSPIPTRTDSPFDRPDELNPIRTHQRFNRPVAPPDRDPAGGSDKPHEPSTDELTRRISVSRRFDCDPNDLIRWFHDSNQQEFSERREIEVVKFDPQSRTNSISSGPPGLKERTVSAYRTIRLLEESGFPRQFSQVGWTSFLHRPAIKILAIGGTNEALGAFLRCRDSDLFDDVLGRVQVARLAYTPSITDDDQPNDSIDKPFHESLFDNVERSLRELIDELPSGVTRSDRRDETEQFMESELRFTLELLSRLVIIQPESTIVAFVERVVGLLDKLQIHKRWWLEENVSQLLTRTCSSVMPSSRWQMLGSLLAVPIKGDEVLTELRGYGDWKDPVSFLSGSHPDTLVTSDNDTKQISLLIETVRSENSTLRQSATLRLLYLFETGLLNRDQVKSWSDALFSQTDDFGFPKETGCLDSLITGLPKQTGFDERKAFRDKYLNDTSERERDYNFFWTLAGTRRINTKHPSRAVKWNRSDIDALIWSASAACDEIRVKREVYANGSKRNAMADDFLNSDPETNETCIAIGDMLISCVVDNPSSTLKQKQTVVELARNAMSSDLPVLSLYPPLISIDDSLKDELESELLLKLVSSARETFRIAARAMNHWLDQCGREMAPFPSARLLLTVVGRLSCPDGEILPAALSLCAKIIRTIPNENLERFVQQVTVEVERLIPQIEYEPSKPRFWRRDRVILSADIPDIRTGIARLVFALQQGGCRSETLGSFLLELQNDCLPEVRRAACGE